MNAGVKADFCAFGIRVMPAFFVLIWSTGFSLPRYGMPDAPPLTFPA
jgi:hypothetical protein